MSAFEGKADMTVCGCPLLRSLLGVKRTCVAALHESAFDPKRTFNVRSILLRLPRHVPRGIHNSANSASAAGFCVTAKAHASVRYRLRLEPWRQAGSDNRSGRP